MTVNGQDCHIDGRGCRQSPRCRNLSVRDPSRSNGVWRRNAAPGSINSAVLAIAPSLEPEYTSLELSPGATLH